MLQITVPRRRVDDVGPGITHRGAIGQPIRSVESRKDHELGHVADQPGACRIPERANDLVGAQPPGCIDRDVLVDRADDGHGRALRGLAREATAVYGNALVVLRESLVRATPEVGIGTGTHNDELVRTDHLVDPRIPLAEISG